MTPDLFGGSGAPDEFCLCSELGMNKAKRRLYSHWQRFITKNDLIMIKKSGLNAVRIPVPYWSFETEDPFISSQEFLDKAMEWAEEVDLQVILDLHTAPGSQNGFDNSGLIGEVNWHKAEDNINRTLSALEKIAQRYGSNPQLFGIELLNEPSNEIGLTVLEDFYIKGYQIIRKNAPESLCIIMHDSFRPNEWESFFTGNDFKNVILDTHLYQCFAEDDINLDIAGHLQKTTVDWKKMLCAIQKYVPVIVGEWSGALDLKSLESLTPLQQKRALKAYIQAQLLVFDDTLGWFFWSYKIHNKAMQETWSFKGLKKELILTK